MQSQSKTKIFCFLSMLLLISVYARPIESAQCFTVTLHDSEGTTVSTEGTVIGIMVGGVPIIDGAFPEYASISTRTNVPCPQELMDELTNLFAEMCSTTQRRSAAALSNRVSLDTIQRSCKNLSTALKETD